MKNALTAFILIMVSLVMVAPAQAGEQRCMACNKTISPSGARPCFRNSIVKTFSYKVMGPAKKSDGRKNDRKVIYKAMYVYDNAHCTGEPLDWSGFSTMGCDGTLWQPGWPEERVVE